MINSAIYSHIAALLLASSTLNVAISAQDVYLSEICVDGNESWIEVHNRGNLPTNIGTWTLHCATPTSGAPNEYWWAFPLGTSLAPGAYLRVHWFENAPAAPAPGSLYTGTSVYGFLFGLGGEALSNTKGAAALFAAQSNAMTISSSYIRDWVSWGSHGFQRESLAISAGYWHAGRATPAIPNGGSIARDPSLIGITSHPDESWFIDYSPTPMAQNVTGAVTQSYGNACTLPGNHLLGLPELRTNSLPLVGNSQFHLIVDNTTGIYGEYVLICFSSSTAPPSLPSILPAYAGFGCQESINTLQLITTWLAPATILGTTMALPLDSYTAQIVGLELHAQALVLDLVPGANPPYQGLSNALRIVVGQ